MPKKTAREVIVDIAKPDTDMATLEVSARDAMVQYLNAIATAVQDKPIATQYDLFTRISGIADPIKSVQSQVKNMMIEGLVKVNAKRFMDKDGNTIKLEARTERTYNADEMFNVIAKEVSNEVANKVCIPAIKVDYRELKKVLDLGGAVAEQLKTLYTEAVKGYSFKSDREGR